MRKKGLLPLILGLLLLTVFALAAFVPELFTSFSQKELFTKWLPVSLISGIISLTPNILIITATVQLWHMADFSIFFTLA